jgi:hypothetical protein
MAEKNTRSKPFFVEGDAAVADEDVQSFSRYFFEPHRHRFNYVFRSGQVKDQSLHWLLLDTAARTYAVPPIRVFSLPCCRPVVTRGITRSDIRALTASTSHVHSKYVGIYVQAHPEIGHKLIPARTDLVQPLI